MENVLPVIILAGKEMENSFNIFFSNSRFDSIFSVSLDGTDDLILLDDCDKIVKRFLQQCWMERGMKLFGSSNIRTLTNSLL